MKRRGYSKEGNALIDAAEALGWTLIRAPGRGYECPCGSHMTWVHRTPSNPNYWKERLAFLGRTCHPTK